MSSRHNEVNVWPSERQCFPMIVGAEAADISKLSPMTITDQLFEAFLQCPTKCFLRAQAEPPTGNVYSDWVREQSESYQSAGVTQPNGAALGD